MGDKDSPLDGFFSGKLQIMIFPHNDAPEDAALLGDVIADSLSIISCEEDEEDTEVNKAIANGKITFTYNSVDVDSDVMSKMLDIGVSPTELTGSVTFGCVPYINRPKNLKHPNKKRARRIWKKWKKRFGVSGQKAIFIPKAKIARDVYFGENGEIISNIHITASK